MNNLAIVVNTNSDYKDILPMFFGQLRSHYNEGGIYTFIDSGEPAPEVHTSKVLYYDSGVCFRDQYLSCIKQVPEKYCITMNDDYLLMNNSLDFNGLKEYITILEETNYSFVRFVYVNDSTQIKLTEKLYKIPFYSANLFSQCASIWKTRTLEQIYEKGPSLHIGIKGDKEGHFEEMATQTCMNLGIEGLVVHDNMNKRGIVHYDSNIFPCMSSAIVKGRWNREYIKELIPLFDKYSINPNIRGFTN